MGSEALDYAQTAPAPEQFPNPNLYQPEFQGYGTANGAQPSNDLAFAQNGSTDQAMQMGFPPASDLLPAPEGAMQASDETVPPPEMAAISELSPEQQQQIAALDAELTGTVEQLQQSLLTTPDMGADTAAQGQFQDTLLNVAQIAQAMGDISNPAQPAVPASGGIDPATAQQYAQAEIPAAPYGAPLNSAPVTPAEPMVTPSQPVPVMETAPVEQAPVTIPDTSGSQSETIETAPAQAPAAEIAPGEPEAMPIAGPVSEPEAMPTADSVSEPEAFAEPAPAAENMALTEPAPVAESEVLTEPAPTAEPAIAADNAPAGADGEQPLNFAPPEQSTDQQKLVEKLVNDPRFANLPDAAKGAIADLMTFVTGKDPNGKALDFSNPAVQQQVSALIMNVVKQAFFKGQPPAEMTVPDQTMPLPPQ